MSAAGIVARLRAAGCVFAEDEARVLAESAADPASLAAMVERRVAGEPLEHVVGWAEFAGLRVAVGPGVFVPRHRTEFLVELAILALRPAPHRRDADRRVLVDLACGSGAIGAAVAHRVPGLRVIAADIEPAAVDCARRNLTAFDAEVVTGDLFDPLPAGVKGHVDVLVANVPYVPSAAVDLLPPEARLYEPLRALDGGPDGLDVLRRVAVAAPDWLAPGGRLLFEIGVDQVDAAKAALAAAGLSPEILADEERDATVAAGTR